MTRLWSRIVAVALLLTIGAAHAAVGAQNSSDWPAVLAAARGQTVHFYAWGGEPRINAYIAWAGAEVERRFGVKLEQVKLADTAEAANRLLAEKSAGRSEGGAVDLVWINGENFAALKQAGMLHGPFVETLPAFALLDTERNPALTTDFTLATEGYEAPWGTAQLTFYYDSAMLSEPPRTLAALAAYVRAHPGRFTYPQPPDFLGTTFLKQVLVTQAPDKAVLARPVDDESFAAASAPVFSYLDEIQKSLWRGGRAFPQNGAGLRALFAEREIDIGFTFNPGDASAAIEKSELPGTVRSFGLLGGTIGNAHFLAIPRNASSKEGAMVVVNFLLSPEAQARKADPRVWGDPTVLSAQKMSPEERGLFDALPRGNADIPPEDAVPVLGEPHASWMTRLEAEWGRRYGEAP